MHLQAHVFRGNLRYAFERKSCAPIIFVFSYLFLVISNAALGLRANHADAIIVHRSAHTTKAGMAYDKNAAGSMVRTGCMQGWKV